MKETMLLITGGLLYGLLLFGFYLLYHDALISMVQKVRARNRLKEARRRYKEAGAPERHLDQLLQVTLGKKIRGVWFLWLCGCVCFGVTCVGMRSMPVAAALLTGCIVAGLPYLLLRIKLEVIRRKSSFEGEVFVGNFLSAYRIANFNLYKAMEIIGKERRETRKSAELIGKMLLELRNTANRAEIKKASDKFAFAIHTNWSRMFAYNIALAAADGTNISLALEDILIQLREAKAASEERRRLNSEAARMVVFLMPILYVVTIWMNARYIGLETRKFLYNQFFTAQGFMLLLMILFMFLINLVLIEVVNNQKFDY